MIFQIHPAMQQFKRKYELLSNWFLVVLVN